MMRITERPLARQTPAAQSARNRLDHAELERLGRFQRRQYAGETCSQHRLARSRRTGHQQIVSASRGDLERAFRALLTLDIPQVGDRWARGGKARLRWGQ